jgi:hypothetical protein
MKTSALILLAIFPSAGCESLKTDVVQAPPTARVEPAPAPVAGTELDQKKVENVRVAEALKAYPTGRYVDPNDPSVMHEGHTIYRREAGPNWNLNPNVPTVVPLGPVLAVADPAKEPTPLPAELEQKMAEQNQLMASLIEQNEALSAQLAKLTKEMEEIRAKQSAANAEGGK